MDLRHDGLPRAGEPEGVYFRRMATEFRQHRRSERRRRLSAWLLGRELSDVRPTESAAPARSHEALG
jgi:hypothetical protein